MAPKFNPRVPKRGVLRSIQKRPASKKNLAWRQTDYVRDPEAVPTIWNDRNKWKRSVADILQSTPSTLVPMLRADGLLPDWEGGQCPRCHRGNLKKAASQKRGGLPKHRCSAHKCQAYINPHHAHPLFVEGTLLWQPRLLCSCFFSIVFRMLLLIAFYISITKPLKIWANAFANCVKPGWWSTKNPFALAQDKNG